MASSPFVFTFYTEEELVACGDAFLASCKQEWQQTGTAVWTEYVLNWFYNTARSGVCVDARTPRNPESPGRETNGEWLVDLAHTTYPKLGRGEYWKNALGPSHEGEWSILLALESEWGKTSAHTRTREMVLDDASKLTALRAAVKVLVSCTAAKEAGSLEHALEILRRRTDDHAPWLWINLPDEETAKSCQFVMFGQKVKIRQACL